MPLLDESAVATALAALRGWSGDTGRIARTVHATGDRAEALQVLVMGVADELDHHPVVEQHGDQLTFILWTHSAGGVTEKDIALAERIDEVIEAEATGPPET